MLLELSESQLVLVDYQSKLFPAMWEAEKPGPMPSRWRKWPNDWLCLFGEPPKIPPALASWHPKSTSIAVKS